MSAAQAQGTASATALRGGICTATDEQLVAAVRAGDDAAFEALYERHHRAIAHQVFRMVADHGRAEDIAQEVFMSALRRMRQTDRPIAFRPWIGEIAKNACIDQFRRTKRRQEIPLDGEEGYGSLVGASRLAQPASPEAAVERKQSLDDLCGAFGGLSEVHHQILVMREFEGLSYDQIGGQLDMSRAAVESTLFRARRRLAEEYEELVTGKRCLRVQAIVAAAGERAIGARDRRRMAVHVAHCQPCRRYAYASGIDIGALRGTVRARIAAVLPIPALLRRRAASADLADAASTHGSTLAQWASQVDPSIADWARAAVAAATVAVAGAGAVEGGQQVASAVAGHQRAVAPARVARVVAYQRPEAVRRGQRVAVVPAATQVPGSAVSPRPAARPAPAAAAAIAPTTTKPAALSLLEHPVAVPVAPATSLTPVGAAVSRHPVLREVTSVAASATAPAADVVHDGRDAIASLTRAPDGN